MKVPAAIDSEKLEVLDGSRNRDKSRAAVRIEDLTGILEIPSTLQSKDAAGAPTQAEFNKVVSDITALHQKLTQVARRLGDRLSPRIP